MDKNNIKLVADATNAIFFVMVNGRRLGMMRNETGGSVVVTDPLATDSQISQVLEWLEDRDGASHQFIFAAGLKGRGQQPLF